MVIEKERNRQYLKTTILEEIDDGLRIRNLEKEDVKDNCQVSSLVTV